MEKDEIQTFRFQAKYTECKLRHYEKFRVTKYVVEKGQVYEGYTLGEIGGFVVQQQTYAYFAVLWPLATSEPDPNQIFRGSWISRATCIKGEVVTVVTAEAFQTGVQISADRCGLATLLSYICMVDDDVRAGMCIDFAKYQTLPTFSGLLTMVPNIEKYCKMVILFQNAADPEIAAKAYLNAAMNANFLHLYTYIPIDMFNTSKPNKGRAFSFSTSDALALYTDDPRNFNQQYGDFWYFCEAKD